MPTLGLKTPRHAKPKRLVREGSGREPGRYPRRVSPWPDAAALVGALVFWNATLSPAFVLAGRLPQPPPLPVALPALRARSASPSPRALHWTLRGAGTPAAPASRCRTRI